MTRTSSTRSWPLLASLVASTACTVAANRGDLTAGGGMATVGSQTSGASEASTGLDEGESSSEIVDLGSPDEPMVECASISQSTTIEDLPSDIIMIAVGDPIGEPADFRRDTSNLLPYLSHFGVEDVEVLFLVAGEPQPDPLTDEFVGCEGWICCPEGACPPDRIEGFPPHSVVDVAFDPERPLTDLIASAGQWASLLRPDARKHVWFVAPDNQDSTTTAEGFLADLEDLDASFAGAMVHAMVWGDVMDESGGDVGAAADITGGLYYDWTKGDHNAEAFYDAVGDAIKTSSLLCAYEIPAPPDGHSFDPGKVNVEYDEGDGLETIGYLSSLSECAAAGAGWYYDDDEAPTQILMCPFSCDRFKSANNATVDIRFGCDTIPVG